MEFVTSENKSILQITMYKLYFVIFTTLSIASCSTSSPSLDAPGTIPANEQDLRELTPAGSLDNLFLDISTDIPEFGGLYIKDDRIQLVVAMPPNELGAAASSELREKIVPLVINSFGEDFFSLNSSMNRESTQKRTITAESIDIVSGKYKFGELMTWKSSARNLLAFDGIESVDLDERTNRIRIGVTADTSQDSVLQAAKELDLPIDALLLETVEPVYFHATLRSRMRPPRGGVQIEIDTSIFGYSTCTFGFNVRRYGQYGFITNSHCTKTQGTVQDDDIHQPDDPIYTFNTKIGDEKADPPYFTGGTCPTGRRCRFSDSAFVKLTTDVGNGIAKTTGWNNGVLELSENPFVLPIIGEQSAWLTGTEIDKIGRTTGWTYGTISSTCVDIDVNDSDVTLFCQNNVVRSTNSTHTMSDSGDSGSPAFKWQGDSALLAGILWGGNDSGTRFVYSPLNQIEQELGPLTTHNFFKPPPPSHGCGGTCCKFELFQGKPICVKCVSTGGICFLDDPPVLEAISVSPE